MDVTLFGSAAEKVARTEELRDYIDRVCIHRVREGELMLPGKKPGTFYTWQFYLRRCLFQARHAETVALLFLDTMRERMGGFLFQVAAAETAGTPIVSAIVLTAARHGITINGFTVRKERKSYGIGNWCEGIVLPDRRVVLVDDMCNSRNELLRAFNVCIGQEHLAVARAWVIVDKQWDVPNNATARDLYLPPVCPVDYAFGLDAFNLITRNKE